MKKLSIAAVVVLLSVQHSPPAGAWDSQGHEIIAYVAEREMTSRSKEGVAKLLGRSDARTLAEASTLADKIILAHPETAAWHFVSIPVGSRGYDPTRDCPNDNCLVRQIQLDMEAVNYNPIKLQLLMHFVGDLEQPLDTASNDDRGGNLVAVRMGDNMYNLHQIWDDCVVKALGSNPQAIAASIDAEFPRSTREDWANGSVVSWANDSFQVATRIYEKLPRPDPRTKIIQLPSSYCAEQQDITRGQLGKAGVRLAKILNQAFP